MNCPVCHGASMEVTSMRDTVRKFICGNPYCDYRGIVYDGEQQDFSRAQAEDDKKLDEILKLWHRPD